MVPVWYTWPASTQARLSLVTNVPRSLSLQENPHAKTADIDRLLFHENLALAKNRATKHWMTSIPLTSAAIKAFIGQEGFNPSQDITSIHATCATNSNVVEVEARIPASTTRQGHYTVTVRLQNDESPSILGGGCTCPIGYKCKHIYKVLRRVKQSCQNPIQGPSAAHLARVARHRQLAEQMDHASVYIAYTCKSQLDSGSDYRRSYYTIDSFEQETLGVFFSKRAANQRAKEYVRDFLTAGNYEEEDEDDMYDSDEDAETFVYDESDLGEYCDDYPNAFRKVWIERQAIEDASPRFRK